MPKVQKVPRPHELAAVEQEPREKKNDKPTEAKLGKYAESAGKPEKPKAQGADHIHCGQKERAPTVEEELEAYTMEAASSS